MEKSQPSYKPIKKKSIANRESAYVLEIRILVALLKTLQGKSSGTILCNEKRV